jgi:hypothetical protein
MNCLKKQSAVQEHSTSVQKTRDAKKTREGNASGNGLEYT